MSGAGSWIVRAVDRLRTIQLPSGEIPSFDEKSYAPCPLLSMLAHDALAYVDPRSTVFVHRIGDLIPARSRDQFFTSVATLRWRLRLYIASEEEADGTWRTYGRQSLAAADAATTACGAAALLQSNGWRTVRQRRTHVPVLRRLAGAGLPPAAAAHVLRFYALAGTDVEELSQQVRERIEAERSLVFAHAIARAFRQGALAGREEIARMVVPGIDGRLFADRLASALGISALIDLGAEERLVTESLVRTIEDGTPFSRWSNDPYGDTGRGSAGATLALLVANVARAQDVR